jgi:hypothetical protein
MREDAVITCQSGFSTAKRLKQDYLLSLFRPAWFQHLQAQHQQNQDLLNSIQRFDTREQDLFGKNPCFIKISTQNISPLCLLPSNSSTLDAKISPGKY